MTLFLTSCSPTQQKYIASPADKASLQKDVFFTPDGAELPYRAWLPKAKPKAVIIALHGMNDYSNAFTPAGEYMRARGIALYAYDQRGFGAGPAPGIWGNAQNLARDLRQFVQAVQARHPGKPLFILGESMGGAVAIAALAGPDAPEVSGVILSAPALWSLNPFYRSIVWSMAHTAPGYRMTGSDLKILASDNIPMLRALGKDPLVIKATRADAVYGLVELMDDAYVHIGDLRAPVLLLYGANDQVIRRDPLEIALARFSRPVTFAYYPKGYHLLLRDLQNEVVLADMAAWMAAPHAPLPSGFGKEIAPQQE